MKALSVAHLRGEESPVSTYAQKEAQLRAAGAVHVVPSDSFFVPDDRSYATARLTLLRDLLNEGDLVGVAGLRLGFLYRVEGEAKALPGVTRTYTLRLEREIPFDPYADPAPSLWERLRTLLRWPR